MQLKRTLVSVFGVLTLSALNGCSEVNVLKDVDQSADEVSINGYGGLKFGDDFKDIVGRYGFNNFNPVSVTRCSRELPIKGCYLVPNREKIFEFVEGIPLSLGAKFNVRGKLTDIGLEYEVRDQATSEQCLEVYMRALDWVIDNHGIMVQRPPSDSENPADFQSKTTPAGNSFQIFSKDGDFIVLPGRTLNGNVRLENLPTDMNEWPNEEHVSVDSFFVAQHCSVSITYSDSALEG